MIQFGTHSPGFGLSDCQSRELEFDCSVGVSNIELINSLNVVLVHSTGVPDHRYRSAVAQWLKRLIINEEITSSNPVYHVGP